MDIIAEYYWDGYPYKAILHFLNLHHGIHITMRTLLRRLNDLGLARRSKPDALIDVWNAIALELQGPGRL